ncbi:hypothetical protein LDENG_00149550 [Lucifuga dentata]|nr:hypothetical protein LDENG_00149550 [Lucifuga dentata]
MSGSSGGVRDIMATMSQTWSVFTVITVLTLQICIGEKSCFIWSSAGRVVQRGSSFKMYCTFYCKCKGSMYSGHPLTLQSHKQSNSTTLYVNVKNITKNRTFSCECKCLPALDPCGLDISTGYPPDCPENITCIHKVLKGEMGVVQCTWKRGRDTYLQNTLTLWVRTVSGNALSSFSVSSKGPDSATFNVSNSVQLMSVCIQAKNPLGSVESDTFNYTLRDIMMPSPPDLGQAKCSSRGCDIKVEESVRTQHLEIQYRSEQQTWTTYQNSVVQMGSVWSISFLEPYTLYQFRARTKFSTGLWSQWSTNISCWTSEEAPAKELDVWFAESTFDFSSIRVYWKEVNNSIARGKILEYIIKIYDRDTGLVFFSNISANSTNYSVSSCTNCEVTVRARNSKGQTPPAKINTPKPPQHVHVIISNNSVAISWRKPGTALTPTGHVVEWHPEGHKLDELQWVRVGGDENHVTVTGIKPFECYEGAVYILQNESTVGSTRFVHVSTVESAPTGSPSAEEKVEGNKVKVTWTELPRSQRGGCIRNYTIYVENIGSKSLHQYPVLSSKRKHVIHNLRPAFYRLWMTAWNAKGEGPAGRTIKFFIQQESEVPLLLSCIVVLLIAASLVCLCQISAVRQRFCMLFHCLMLDVVPDPANSKWARECDKEKGRMNLQLQLSNSTVTEEEDELITVDVEELHEQSGDISIPASDGSSPLLPHTSLGPKIEPAPVLSYIKSFSHDSDSSDQTQTSLDTNTTVDYISSHGPENEIEDDVDQGDQEEFMGEVMGFFPSLNVFMDPLKFGGKLTLDAVKIDCSSFFQDR